MKLENDHQKKTSFATALSRKIDEIKLENLKIQKV